MLQMYLRADPKNVIQNLTFFPIHIQVEPRGRPGVPALPRELPLLQQWRRTSLPEVPRGTGSLCRRGRLPERLPQRVLRRRQIGEMRKVRREVRYLHRPKVNSMLNMPSGNKLIS